MGNIQQKIIKNVLIKIKIVCDRSMYSFADVLKVIWSIKQDAWWIWGKIQLYYTLKFDNVAEKRASNSIYVHNSQREADPDIELNKEQSLHYLRHTHTHTHTHEGHVTCPSIILENTAGIGRKSRKTITEVSWHCGELDEIRNSDNNRRVVRQWRFTFIRVLSPFALSVC